MESDPSAGPSVTGWRDEVQKQGSAARAEQLEEGGREKKKEQRKKLKIQTDGPTDGVKKACNIKG